MNIIPFDFAGLPVRVVTQENVLYWVASDVARVLEISEIRSTLRAFSPSEKGVHSVHTPGGEQKMLMVSEEGLYRLIFQSRKKSAKAFQKWVFAEVLPAIRRTGKYATPEPTEQADAAERATIPAYLGMRPALTFDELVYFGSRVRQFAQSLGISYEFELDDSLGRVRSYARPVLEMAWTQLLKKRAQSPRQLDLFIASEAA